ncbi:ABC transporter permease [Oceanicoccus sp. KOV_DT_Chl]|uniref:PhnE/PtxC family ABC transporter permease n=1 Tax=Oceanicoccus sp. KOV_DT_Chl TaxID=1904639 RepID=UPI000C7CCC81|nr:ABC transporter permease [Oceanicoccus sp. KOV_DT_Chl]
MRVRAHTANSSTHHYSAPAGLRSFAILLISGLFCLALADIEITHRSPMLELNRMLSGLLSPQLLPWPELFDALFQTLSYAVLAVSSAAVCGFLLSFLYQRTIIRISCTFIRSVHELFWGLVFIQLFGIHPLTGFLAIAIPYSGIFAKVFAEIREEHQSLCQLPPHSDSVSRFFYGHWPQLVPHFASYIRYRMECGLRSSTILGFIGLPTLGFHLETAFMQGMYSQTAGLLLLFYGLIATLPFWLRFKALPFYCLLALWYLWPQHAMYGASLAVFFADITPAPFTNGANTSPTLLPWLTAITTQELLPGVINTLVLSQVALLFTALLAMVLFPLVSQRFFALPIRLTGHGLLIFLRSTPELIIAFALLILLGPSMLPAIIALAIHNGAIIANLVGRQTDQIQLRLDASKGFHRYSFEILPRIYGPFLALLCYRWEVILRESAILGILGIHTLGFFIDSAFERFALDVALLLIIVSALLNICVDQGSRLLRHRLHLPDNLQSQTTYAAK